jgi:sarcosine oxidase
MRFDVIVLGLGGMGSAAVYHLAGRGRKVLGLDQFAAAHDKGSSHGKTRVIRQSYYEDPAYVPLLLRAYELWRQLEAESGGELLFEVGGLMIGTEASAVVRGSLRSALAHGLPHEVLDAAEIARRFPAFRPGPEMIALYERRAGYLRPEQCVLAHLDQAARRGADLHFGEKVIRWTAATGGDGVVVETARGTYAAEQLVIAPGPWAPQILAEAGLGAVLEVERQVLYWFDSSLGMELFGRDRFPIFIWETESGAQPYGFPAIDGPGGGVKVALHRAPVSVLCTPENIERQISAAEIGVMRETIAPLLPGLDGACVAAATCLYTNTPDKHFILARHPKHGQVAIAGGFSGHGFKFASVVGEILTDLVTAGATRFDIDFMRPERFRL